MGQRKIKLYFVTPEDLGAIPDEDTIYYRFWTYAPSWESKDFKINVSAKSCKYIKYTSTQGKIHSGLEVKTDGLFLGDATPKYKEWAEFIDDLAKQNEACIDYLSYAVLIKQGLQYKSMVHALRQHVLNIKESDSLL
jgi:hypothetical protein